MKTCWIILLLITAIAWISILSHDVLAKGPFHGTIGVDIERSFGTGNPEYLKPYLDNDTKIYLSIPALEVAAGNYSKKQVIQTFKRIFERVMTRRFILEGGQFPNLSRGPIRANWVYQVGEQGINRTTALYFTITSNPLAPRIKSIRGE